MTPLALAALSPLADNDDLLWISDDSRQVKGLAKMLPSDQYKSKALLRSPLEDEQKSKRVDQGLRLFPMTKG